MTRPTTQTWKYFQMGQTKEKSKKNQRHNIPKEKKDQNNQGEQQKITQLQWKQSKKIKEGTKKSKSN
jgi:hypothetical protein